ncbi:MAG: mechanosensitive ion channel family protein [Gemmatimonadetes bacterium]|nr:mechanosensitive ion channel family protein [Gemmatimonadota bacterium]
MTELLAFLGWDQLLSHERIVGFTRAAIVLIIGFTIGRILAALISGLVGRRGTPQHAVLTRHVVFYGIALLALSTALHQVGLHMGVLLGAAGVLSVAIGFASQASASNLVSGLFLIAEKPFVIGDVIQIDGQKGEILSIDLLSVKLRTFDNLSVRVPNEKLIQSTVINLSRFPIRRVDIPIGVAYKEDMDRVRDILMEAARVHPLSLEEPNPLFIYKGYGDSSLDIQFSIWTRRENYLTLVNEMRINIKKAFDEAGIEIPFPHRSLYAGSITDPFPVQVIDGDRTPQATPGDENR